MLLSGLVACSTPQTHALLHTPAVNLTQQVELDAVKFFPQEIHQCGPAALAMVLDAGGVMRTPQELSSQVYLPGREGSLQVEMMAAVRRSGLLAYELAPRLRDLLAEVAAGTPVVVLQNLGLSWYPVWHYAVVVGYDLQQEVIILRSGLEYRQVLAMTTFEHTWKRSGYWAMLALPPDKTPITADESVYIQAALALENTGQQKSAEAAYLAALALWPRNIVARIGAGNAAYLAGDKPRAELAYRQATLDHPDSAVAFNNLAQTLADQDRLAEALASANQAVDLGGRDQAVFLETLQQIKQKTGR